MNQILGVGEPIIRSYPFRANVTSILNNHPYFLDWLYNNHIQLFCGVYPAVTNFDTYLDTYEPLSRVHYPLIETQFIKKEIFTSNGMDICEFIMNSINLGYYVYLGVDTFYLPLYSSPNHLGHDIFIYGYNSENKQFYVADFFNGTYSREVVEFNSFRNAFESEFSDTNEFKGIQLLKRIDEGHQSKYQFNVEYVVTQLEDYNNEVNTSMRYAALEVPLLDPEGRTSGNRTWGLGVYRSLAEVFDQETISPVTLRSLHALYEHKKLMTARVSYLINRGFLDDTLHLENKITQIENNTLKLRNYFMKCLMSNKYNREKTQKWLFDIQKSDGEFINELIELLKK